MSTSAKPAVNVQEMVAQALQLSERLQLLLSNERQHVIKTNRDGLCLLHWSLIFEHHQGILVLLQQRLPAPAFALLRPLEEAFLRSFLVMHGTDEQAEAIKDGTYRTEPELIGNLIDQKLGLMKAHFGSSFKTKMPVLHGFTHGGKEQLARQASGLDIVSSYTDDEVCTLVKETMWVVFLAALFITDFLGYPAENQAAMQMLNDYVQPVTNTLRYKISVARLKELQSAIHFANDGDGHEQAAWSLFNERFSNLERFWQRFIVPMTKRIELDFQQQGRHERRDGIAEDLWMVSYLHYSAFMHLVYAAQHLQQPMLSSFGDFYSHLGSACDLAEDFLSKTYLVVQFCRGENSKMLQALSKPEFLTIASKLYDSRYPKLYEHYYSKGKGFALKIPQRESILGEYFAEDDAWKSYRKFSDSVRTYRNRIVHDVLIGEINAADARLVPKKEKITSYQKLSEIFAAAGNPEKLKTDFIIMQEQMVGDYAELQTRLNVLWEKPLADMDSLFFQQRNVKLLEKYNLYLVD